MSDRVNMAPPYRATTYRAPALRPAPYKPALIRPVQVCRLINGRYPRHFKNDSDNYFGL